MAENGMRGGGSSDMTNGHEKDPTTTTNDNDKSASATARMNETTQKYVQDLLAERARMDNFPLAMKLIDEALERVKLTGRIPNREQYADVYQQRTIKLSQKVHVPIKDKKFNYVGKLLGPKGNSLRRLQEETQCKIVILGRFSMKDRVREEELRNSADPKYAHLNLPLHVEVSTIAPPAEAYARVAYALAQIRRYLIPDKHDDIRQEQFRELMEDPEAAKKITIRQQQQQHHQQQQHGGGGGGSHQYRGNGQYRPKFHQQVYHNNDETVYYRSHNNAYHQQKQYVPPSQRSNPMHASLPPQAIVGATASGMVLNAANYNGRNHLLTNSNNGLGGGVNSATGGGGAPGHMRYRPNGPYQYVKK